MRIHRILQGEHVWRCIKGRGHLGNPGLNEDMYVAGSMLMLLTLLSVFGTLVSDLLLLVLDPRIRMEAGSR